MSETNFTEQDTRWLERLEIPTGPSNSRTKEATTHAIAEIDSLRIDLVAVESNYDGQNAALTEILKLCGYNLPDGDTAGNYGDEVAVGEVRKVLAERESLRAQLAAEKERSNQFRRAANLGGPPTGRTCSVDGHDIYGPFHGEAGIDGPVICALHWYQRTEDENKTLRAQLGEAQAEAAARLKQTETQIRMHTANTREWRKALDAAEAENNRLASFRQERDTLRSEVERTKAALRLIQWGGVVQWGGEQNFGRFCPQCRRFKRDGHAPDCEVGAALAGETKPVVADRATTQPTSEYIGHCGCPIDGEHGANCPTIMGDMARAEAQPEAGRAA